MSSKNSFGTLAQLQAGGEQVHMHSLPATRAGRLSSSGASPLLAEDPTGKPLAM